LDEEEIEEQLSSSNQGEGTIPESVTSSSTITVVKQRMQKSSFRAVYIFLAMLRVYFSAQCRFFFAASIILAEVPSATRDGERQLL
jgi:hypothetical protein